MAFNKAIPVLLSDTINIPQPGAYQTGASSTGTTTLTTTGAKFKGVSNPGNTGYSNKVAVGDVVYVDSNTTNRPSFITQVSAVVSDEVLTLSPAVSGIAAPYNYNIYRSNGGSNNLLQGNKGYGLLGPFGTNTVVKCVLAGQTDAVFIKPNDTSDLTMENIKIQRVFETGSTNVDEFGLIAVENDA